MDSGLSERVIKTLEVQARGSSAHGPLPSDPTTSVNLSNTQNEVLRPELIDFFKTAAATQLDENALNLLETPGGNPELRGALSSFFNTYFKPIHSISSDHIVVTAGATDAIDGALHAICDEGDSIIVPGPSKYVSDGAVNPKANVNVVVARPPAYRNYDNYLLPSIEAAYDFSADRSRIKAVLLTNPNDPLARCYPRSALIGCMEFCQERNLHLIVDEIHALSALDERPQHSHDFISALALTEPLMPDGALKIDQSRVHIVWSASKLFGVSGLRVGCLISQHNPQLIAATSILTANHANNVSCLLLTSLLTSPRLPELIALNTSRLTDSCRLLTNALRSWNVNFVPPSDGFFLFAKLAKHARSAEEEMAFYDKLARHGIVVKPGRFFKGVEMEYGWARIRFSISAILMQETLERLETFMQEDEG